MTQSEDDTFNRLRRPSYGAMIAKLKEIGAPPGWSYITYNREYIKTQGWDVEEIHSIYRENYIAKRSREAAFMSESTYDIDYPRGPG